ncbi:sugar ABC transporter ATP-binding protein [Salipaludibacillus keqinensis]|uniref:Sugar ABC transporter ATP-binding protein n=1 Tax=Salipaludibacillus keqinensis TaxID=2045207 RepID=A0A323TIL9_9BACI|nr:carbohydrate ABC transporter permease [Salipaludibacillus keqinensis]PYZ94668.1 sugar ABC transporter ATP-binding protein [Salipaludibacillus keqinensis]
MAQKQATSQNKAGSRKALKTFLNKVFVYMALFAGGFIFLVPFFWMVSTSLKDSAVIFQFPPQWIPDPIVWGNYVEAMTFAPFHLFFANSLIIASLSMIGEVFTGALVAYGFAKLEFKGKNVLFIIVLATMMLPGEVTMIPVFIMFSSIGWIDTFLPLIVPSYFGGSAFFIFMLRQFFLGIPNELEDAARIDGCNTFQIFYKIALPLSKPALAVVAIFSFHGKWNDFLGPLIYLNSMEKYTVQLGLAMFQGMFQTEWSLLMAASIVALLPVLLIFFMFQKYFIEGIKLSGIKG